MLFRFDDQLMEETVGKLQPNKLTVDNLTVEWLKSRITDLEVSLKDCQSKIKNINECIDGKSAVVDGIIFNGHNLNDDVNDQNELNR